MNCGRRAPGTATRAAEAAAGVLDAARRQPGCPGASSRLASGAGACSAHIFISALRVLAALLSAVAGTQEHRRRAARPAGATGRKLATGWLGRRKRCSLYPTQNTRAGDRNASTQTPGRRGQRRLRIQMLQWAAASSSTCEILVFALSSPKGWMILASGQDVDAAAKGQARVPMAKVKGSALLPPAAPPKRRGRAACATAGADCRAQ